MTTDQIQDHRTEECSTFPNHRNYERCMMTAGRKNLPYLVMTERMIDYELYFWEREATEQFNKGNINLAIKASFNSWKVAFDRLPEEKKKLLLSLYE